MMAPLFSADSSWNCEGIGGWQGRDAVVAGLREVSTTGITWALHYMTQPIIKVAEDGASAEGDYYLWELARMTPEGAPAQDTWIGGWYETTFVKQDGTWLFNHMELVLKLMSPTDRPTWDTLIPPWKP